jgi:cytochrome c-type biogenesis protein CcmH/NrfF
MFCPNLELEPVITTKEELRAAFLDYVIEKIHPKNERKATRILEIGNNLQCFKCFDIKRLITERKYLPLSALDCKGNFDLIHCDFCSDGSVIKPTKYFRERRNYKTLRYAKMIHLEDIASELYFLSLENEIGEPDWEFAENELFSHKISHISVDVDIKEVVNLVQSMISDYFVDPSSLTSFIETLQIKIKNFYSTSRAKKEICKKVEKNGETTYIIFDLEKESKKSNGNMNFMNLSFEKKSEIITTHLMCIQPKNRIAEQLCNEMMNKKVKNMIETVNRYTGPYKGIIKVLS